MVQAVAHQADRQVGNVDADPAAVEAFRDRRGGAAAAEWVKDKVALVAAGADDAFQQGFGFLGLVIQAFRERGPIGGMSVQISCKGTPGISDR